VTRDDPLFAPPALAPGVTVRHRDTGTDFEVAHVTKDGMVGIRFPGGSDVRYRSINDFVPVLVVVPRETQTCPSST
jgi:hypothetical protein